MNKKISNSGVRPNSSIFSNIDTKIIKKSSVKNNDNVFNKSYIEKYTQDLPGPLFTDQQIDEYIKHLLNQHIQVFLPITQNSL